MKEQANLEAADISGWRPALLQRRKHVLGLLSGFGENGLAGDIERPRPGRGVAACRIGTAAFDDADGMQQPIGQTPLLLCSAGSLIALLTGAGGGVQRTGVLQAERQHNEPARCVAVCAPHNGSGWDGAVAVRLRQTCADAARLLAALPRLAATTPLGIYLRMSCKRGLV